MDTMYLSRDRAIDFEKSFTRCLYKEFKITSREATSLPWSCPIDLEAQNRVADCAHHKWDLKADRWNIAGVDSNLQEALRGGVDVDGLYWEGRRPGSPLAETFGRQFWNVYLKCTLANPCQHPFDCNSVGSFRANPFGQLSGPVPSRWVYFATAAFVNINQQLRNQWDALNNAINNLAFNTFTIDNFFPSESQNFDLFNSLTGLSGIFSILGGFVPVAGPFIAAAGTIASGVGTFLQNSAAASPTDPIYAQKIFSEKVLTFSKMSLDAMDDLVTKLFDGDPIPAPGPGSFTLLDMMKDGAWVNPNTLTNVSNLNSKIKREILSRSIDSLWKSRTPEQTIKMWVLFTDLSNDPNSTECSRLTHPQLMARVCIGPVS
ncbi:MAG: hypothetical protein Q9198_001829 [Flavoplaca austrocitrina]